MHAPPALLAAIFLVALLYSSVGHGGASGFLAALCLFGFPLAQMKGSALLLNLLVAGASFVNFRRAGHFDGRLLWPFAAASIPLAFLGGFIRLPAGLYALLLAAALAAAACRLMLPDPKGTGAESKPPNLPVSLGVGGGIGLVSGLVGVGGGIFLSPLMILLGWADAKRTAAVSAAFIWLNSASGLYAQVGRQGAQALSLWPLAAVSLLGGILGSHFGSRRLDTRALRRLLGVVLLIASYKLAMSVTHR